MNVNIKNISLSLKKIVSHHLEHVGPNHQERLKFKFEENKARGNPVELCLTFKKNSHYI